MEFDVRERQIRFAGTRCSHAMYRVGNSGYSFCRNKTLSAFYLVLDNTL